MRTSAATPSIPSPSHCPTAVSTSARHGLAALSLVVACDAAPIEDPAASAPTTPREAWTPADDPSLLGESFVRLHAQLPSHGAAAATPWPGNYWPTALDSINHRWAGDEVPSPAEKYGLAFGVDGVEDVISAYFGVDSLYGPTCDDDAQCGSAPAAVCARRRDEEAGRCGESWFGICHAWAPAAILEPEPERAVTYNGVEFQVNDLKALMSLAYTAGLEVRGVSLRCDEDGEAHDLGELPQCKDTNAGTFHVVIANLLGLRAQAFIEDRTYDYQVWNQPVVAYEVLADAPITAAEANLALGARGPLRHGDAASGEVAVGEWAPLGAFPVAAGEHLVVSMVGAGDPDLYVRWGGPPNLSEYECRPFLTGARETCELVVPDGVSAAYVSIFGYEHGTYEVDVDVYDPPPPGYAFNDEAVALRRVRAALHWIGESPAELDGPLTPWALSFTNVDEYEYVLELDGGGEIIGGEWLGASRTDHPDFLWVPVHKYDTVVAGVIAYADVKALFEQAVGP